MSFSFELVLGETWLSSVEHTRAPGPTPSILGACLLSSCAGLQALCRPVAARTTAVLVVLERLADLPLLLRHLPSLLV